MATTQMSFLRDFESQLGAADVCVSICSEKKYSHSIFQNTPPTLFSCPIHLLYIFQKLIKCVVSVLNGFNNPGQVVMALPRA